MMSVSKTADQSRSPRSTQSHGCSAVHGSETPCRESPSAGLDSVSIHSNQTFELSLAKVTVETAATWFTSSGREAPRISDETADSLSTNHMISLSWKSSGETVGAAMAAKASIAMICCLRSSRCRVMELFTVIEKAFGLQPGVKITQPIRGILISLDPSQSEGQAASE